MMSRGVLYVISGPSGTGKGTVCDVLKEDNNIYLSVSTTSRDKRAGETAGVTYNYTTPEKFEEMIENGEMLEWAKYSENYYGTPRSVVEQKLEEGIDVILEIEPQGAFKVKDIMPECVMIFILPPSMHELKNRLIGRGRENEEQIKTRINNAIWELNQADKYNYVVTNDILENCVNKIRNIMNNTKETRNFIDELLEQKVF